LDAPQATADGRGEPTDAAGSEVAPAGFHVRPDAFRGINGSVSCPDICEACSRILVRRGRPARVAQLRDQVAAGLRTTFASSYTAQVSLPGALCLDAIADYGRQATGSKYVIIPSPAA